MNSDGKDYLYFLLHITSGGAFLHALDCDKQDRSKLIALGVEVRDRKCVLDKVADPNTLFTMLNASEPTVKLVRE